MSEKGFFGKVLGTPGEMLRLSRMSDIKMAMSKQDVETVIRLMRQYVQIYKLPDDGASRQPGSGVAEEQERQEILRLAASPEILSRLPIEKFGYRSPVPPMPDAALLQERLTRLSPEEMREAKEATIRRIKEGKLAVAINGKTDKENIQLLPANEDVLLGTTREQLTVRGGMESSHIYNALVPGYRAFKRRLTPESYQGLFFSRGVRSLMEDKYRKKHLELDQAIMETLGYSFITSAEDVYLKMQERQDELVRGGETKRRSVIHDGKLVAGEFYPTEDPIKCFRLSIKYAGGLRSDVRQAFIEFLIPICPTSVAYDSMRSQKESAYEKMLRALRTDPGFLLDVLRDALPEVFTAIEHRKDYYPQPDQNKMYLLVPELKAIGVPERVLFTPKPKT